MESLKVNKRGGGGGCKNCISSVVSVILVPFASYITERMIRKLALSHTDIFSKQLTVGKCLIMDYFHRTILGLVGTMSSLLKILISGEGGLQDDVIKCTPV